MLGSKIDTTKITAITTLSARLYVGWVNRLLWGEHLRRGVVVDDDAPHEVVRCSSHVASSSVGVNSFAQGVNLDSVPEMTR